MGVASVVKMVETKMAQDCDTQNQQICFYFKISNSLVVVALFCSSILYKYKLKTKVNNTARIRP